MVATRFENMRNVYHEYPSQFWLLMAVTLIDRIGGALVFPFFSLYITQKFDVGMTQVGIVFVIFAGAGVISGTIGGALTDRFGRKQVVILGLVISALSSLMMAFVDSLALFYAVAGFVGLFANMGGPARQAMIADLLPEEQRADGFGIQRVVVNIAVTIGPMLGGLLASYSFILLFVADAVTSVITAIVITFTLRETRPEPTQAQEPETIGQTFRGYGKILRDRPFMAFLGISILMTIVYVQMYSTLAVFLRDEHGFSERGFGYIMSMNAAMVVFMQFWITRRIKAYPPLLMMALGSALYAVGFGMYGFVTATIFFFVAMAIVTIGEMVALPVASALVARFSPENMRGRYMAIFAFAWELPGGVGPLLAGLMLDNYDPQLLWYSLGVLGAVAALGYVGLYQQYGIHKQIPTSIEVVSEVGA